MKITLCGAGNAAQLLIALLGRTHEVTVFAPLGDEAERLRAACATTGLCALFTDGVQLGRPARITADAQTAAQRAEMVLLATPAFAHEPVLAALAPHLAGGVQIAALPARGGFDWMAQRSVALPPRTTLIGLQSFPWACRIRTWGRTVEALGVKAEVDAAVWPAEKAEEALAQLEALLGVRLRLCSNFLALTLANPSQLIHPGIMYGLFHGWDGASFVCEEAPLFYGGVDDFTAGILQALSDEVQLLRRALEQCDPALDLRCVEPLDVWLRRAYAGQIDDPSHLRSAFNTNRAYAGLRAPVQRLENGQCIPDFTHRYLSEDLPFGLLVTKGVAALVDVATPVMDRIVAWAQERLGRSYLVGGRIAGPDVTNSRAPQRFGIGLSELLTTVAPVSPASGL
ncbi:NAD/NADP-dependent octopine/nopaline dehydrogenase family protein [Caldilinea sp.]|jgi:hypothetical protein|uniref:NAD/NADP-dependent octopine/nopaline dehydrogenase family protein n=1 Tax=Caldilinea sp. TaxID=2293560 RepID=UPI0021DE56CA|nr:NAD/NADP-dependent octopine/nopaline dehydrogenase family protein [Caldilinea sp.]GIV68818.1 MAG: hypothetical protein KatS3mg048_1680 [Caldilinea sp.]